MLAWTGLPQLLLIPLVPRLMRRYDARWVIAIDFALFAGSNFLNAHMSADTAADQLNSQADSVEASADSQADAIKDQADSSADNADTTSATSATTK